MGEEKGEKRKESWLVLVPEGVKRQADLAAGVGASRCLPWPWCQEDHSVNH